MGSSKQKIVRINEKLNIYNFFPRIFWQFCNFLFYRTIFFVDTNIAISKKGCCDKRVKKLFCLNKNIVVSEPIHYEILKKLSLEGEFQNNLPRCKNISINQIKENYPEACPMFYNSIIGMNNPAIINDLSFFYENYFYPLLKNKATNSRQERVYWNKLQDKLKKGLNKDINILGDKRSEAEKLIDESFFYSMKKKKKEIDYGSRINDYKNIATAFLYSIFYEKNVVLVTADRDLVYAFLSLIDHLTQQMVFMNLVLEKISTEKNCKEKICRGEVVSLYIEKKHFDELENSFRSDILSRDWKKHSFRFTVKFWDVKKKKYIKPIWINFDKKTLDLFKKTFGGVTCPFAKNSDYGNWIIFKYLWPPRNKYALENSLIEFEVKRKESVCKESRKVPWVVHNTNCYFSRMDQAGKLSELSGFSE